MYSTVYRSSHSPVIYLFIYLFIVTIYYCYYYYISTAVGVLSRWVEALATVWTRRSDGSTSSRPVWSCSLPAPSSYCCGASSSTSSDADGRRRSAAAAGLPSKATRRRSTSLPASSGSARSWCPDRRSSVASWSVAWSFRSDRLGKVKGKVCQISYWSVGGMLISLPIRPWARRWINHYCLGPVRRQTCGYFPSSRWSKFILLGDI